MAAYSIVDSKQQRLTTQKETHHEQIDSNRPSKDV